MAANSTLRVIVCSRGNNVAANGEIVSLCNRIELIVMFYAGVAKTKTTKKGLSNRLTISITFEPCNLN